MVLTFLWYHRWQATPVDSAAGQKLLSWTRACLVTCIMTDVAYLLRELLRISSVVITARGLYSTVCVGQRKMPKYCWGETPIRALLIPSPRQEATGKLVRLLSAACKSHPFRTDLLSISYNLVIMIHL